MTSMRQVWRALPRPNPITCECCMVFGRVLPIFPALLWLLSRPHVLMMLMMLALGGLLGA